MRGSSSSSSDAPPPVETHETLSASLATQGTYYVTIGSHKGYGDIGQYTINGSIQQFATYDPGSRFTIPWQSGFTGIGVGFTLTNLIDGSGKLADGYSDACLERVWRATSGSPDAGCAARTSGSTS